MSDLKDNVERTQPTAAPVRLIDIADIHVGERLRALKQKKVTALADLMAEVGQLQPIVVREPNHYADTIKAKYVLLAGLHRLQAGVALGWDQIQATVLDYGDCADIDAAALVEIDENLCRAELSAAERAAHIGRRKEIYEKLHPETKHGAAPSAGPGRGKKRPKSPSWALSPRRPPRRPGNPRRRSSATPHAPRNSTSCSTRSTAPASTPAPRWMRFASCLRRSRRTLLLALRPASG